MDTQVINKNAKNENAKDTLKKGAALAGAAGLGAGAVVSADVIRGDEGELDIVDPISPLEVADATNGQTTGQYVTNPEEQPESVEAHVATETSANHVSSSAEPQPQESPAHHEDNMVADTTPTPAPSPSHEGVIDTNDIPDVDPNLVAQNLTDDVIMVDPTDNDMGNLDIAAVGTVETVDGQVLSAAQFTGDNGETIYAVDVDGDNTYDVVTDASGNVLADIPSTLTVSDSENIVSVNNGDTGYLAQNEHDDIPEDGLDNPMDDVVDLG